MHRKDENMLRKRGNTHIEEENKENVDGEREKEESGQKMFKKAMEMMR